MHVLEQRILVVHECLDVLLQRSQLLSSVHISWSVRPRSAHYGVEGAVSILGKEAVEQNANGFADKNRDFCSSKTHEVPLGNKINLL